MVRLQIYRSVQYFARFLAYALAQRGYSKELIAQLAALKSTLGQSRKRECMSSSRPMSPDTRRANSHANWQAA